MGFFTYLTSITDSSTTYSVKIGTLVNGIMQYQIISVPLSQDAFVASINNTPVAQIQLYDKDVLLAEFSNFTPGVFWQVQPMLDGSNNATNYCVAWNPSVSAVVIMSDNVTTMSPHT